MGRHWNSFPLEARRSSQPGRNDVFLAFWWTLDYGFEPWVMAIKLIKIVSKEE